MPLDLRPFGGYHLNRGRAGQPSSPVGWQWQPGDHSDTGLLRVEPPVSGTVAVAFGFSLAGTAAQTNDATVAVTFGFSVAATATVTATEETTFCDYDYADDTYDNAADTYDCSAASTVQDWYPGPLLTSAMTDDDGDDLLLMVATLRSRLRL